MQTLPFRMGKQYSPACTAQGSMSSLLIDHDGKRSFKNYVVLILPSYLVKVRWLCSGENVCVICIFVCVKDTRGCCDKVPWTGWLKQQKRIFSEFWRLEVQDQCSSRVSAFWEGWICSIPLFSFWWFAVSLVFLGFCCISLMSTFIIIITFCVYAC